VISANDFGKTFEDTILRFIGKLFPEDIATIERGIRKQMRKIARNELLAPEVRSNFKRLANEPMKFQASVVIDQEVHSNEGATS
jgi:predicted TIM-barrel fold metal-dependent hydrolase